MNQIEEFTKIYYNQVQEEENQVYQEEPKEEENLEEDDENKNNINQADTTKIQVMRVPRPKNDVEKEEKKETQKEAKKPEKESEEDDEIINNNVGVEKTEDIVKENEQNKE